MPPKVPGKKVITVYVPEEIWYASKLCADSIGQSLSQFAVFAMAQRARKWRHPLTGSPVAQDAGEQLVEMQRAELVCNLCGCYPVATCSNPEGHEAGGQWFTPLWAGEGEQRHIAQGVRHPTGELIDFDAGEDL